MRTVGVTSPHIKNGGIMQVKFQLAQISKNLRLLTGVLACTGFLVGTACFLHVFTITEADATTSTTANMDMAVNLDPTIEVWTTDYDSTAGTPCTNVAVAAVNINADPDGEVYSDDVCVHASTNAAKGYTLTMATVTADPTLNHTTKASLAPITPLDNTTAHPTVTTDGISAAGWQSDSGLTNTWGYGLSSIDNYKPMVGNADSITVDTTNAPTSDGTTQTTFATKIDISQAAGSYTNTVIFSAVANPDTDAYMQDFTPTVCNQLTPWGYNSATGTVIQGTTISLWDKRDNQEYKVRRLADGNCWMVENFNLSAESLTANGHSTTLDNTDTDLTQGTTFTVPATSNTNWGGDSYPVEPKIATSNVSGYTDYGMYYNWWAATARTTNVAAGGTNVAGSICPKGWHLPTGAVGEFRAVIAAHQAAYGFTNLNGSGNDMSKINRTNDLANDTVGPNLQFSGAWSHSAVVPVAQSSDGYLWSSTVYSEPGAYTAYVYSGGTVYADGASTTKRNGRSVRCILSPSS